MSDREFMFQSTVYLPDGERIETTIYVPERRVLGARKERVVDLTEIAQMGAEVSRRALMHWQEDAL